MRATRLCCLGLTLTALGCSGGERVLKVGSGEIVAAVKKKGVGRTRSGGTRGCWSSWRRI